MKLICSNDSRLVDDYLTEKINCKEDYQVVVFEGISQIINLLTQRALFQDHLRVIIKNCTFITDKNRLVKSANLSELNNILPRINHEEVYLTSLDFDRRTLPKEIEALLKKIEIIKIPALSGKLMIHNYIKKYADKIGLKLDKIIINHLVNSLVPDAGIIVNEIDKLFLGCSRQITVEKIKELGINYNDSDYKRKNVFRLLNQIILGDSSTVIKMYDQLISEQYTPGELLQIIISQLFTLKLVSELIQNGIERDEIKKKLVLTDYFFWANERFFNTHFLKKFIKMFQKACELDLEWKSGFFDPGQCMRAHMVWFCGLFK